MLAALRKFTGTWPAKIFFVLLIASFGLWGVSDVARNLLGGVDPNSVATVGSQRIDPTELQDVSRRMLTQIMRSSGNPVAPTAEQRRAVAEQALDGLVIQAAFAAEAVRLRVSVPDEALRRATFETRAFQGPDGKFNRAVFTSVLRNNNYTETRYLSLLRTDLAQREIVEAVRAGGTSPDIVNRLAFAYDGETRVADMVSLPFAAAAQPPAPTDEQIEREYDDNATAYRAPEYRRIKVVILSPESIAKDIDISDVDARTYYDSHKAQYARAASRSVQVIVAPTEAIGKALATAWLTGADWDAMQKQAATANASALELDDTTQAAFPAPGLASAVFAAPPQAVTGPEQAEGGWAVFRVTKDVAAGQQEFEAVQAEIKARMALEQATDQVYDRANKVQDALAGGAKLDELPAGLGLSAVTGTLDAHGNTPDGTPAPIPGDPALRQAIIARGFTLAVNDQPTLEDGPEHSFYAVSVDAITPPEQLPLDKVRDRVRDDWLRDERRHEQDLAATKLLTAVEGGASLKDAAAAAGLPMTRTAPLTRGAGQPGIPAGLTSPVFATAVNHAAMVENATGFIVAVPVSVTRPDPATDPAGLDRVARTRAGQVSNDLEMTFAVALRDREHVVVNRPMFDSIAP
jgi:peptidyl-prolyl cis-trans isomerase D